MKRIRKYGIVVVIAVISIAAVLFFSWNTPIQTDAIEVIVKSPYQVPLTNPTAVESFCRSLAKQTNQLVSFLSVVEDSIVKTFPYAQTVEVSANPIGLTTVEVWEKVLLAKFVSPQNKSYYVTEALEIFPIPKNHNAPVLLVKGKLRNLMKTSKLKVQLKNFLKKIQEDTLTCKQIGSIFAADTANFKVSFKTNSPLILLGNLENIDAKLEKLQLLQTQIETKALFRRYKEFDLQNVNCIIGRL